MDIDAFDAFDDGPPPASTPTAAKPTAQAPSPPPSTTRRSAFGHLEAECIASISYHNIEDEARARLEQVLRECAVPTARKRQRPESTPACALATAGSVHYFQAFAADFAGASSVAAAAAASSPRYERLLAEPVGSSRGGKGGGKGGGAGLGKGGGRGGAGSGGRGGRGPVSAVTSFSGRYYDQEATVRPGELSRELRGLLGMRDGDPPPYLARMQQLGFPPGYLGDPHAGEETPLELLSHEAATAEAGAEASAGARTTDGTAASSRDRGAHDANRHVLHQPVPLVEIPGLNVAPPPGANLALWNWRGRGPASAQ